jgi:hypothetical protein
VPGVSVLAVGSAASIAGFVALFYVLAVRSLLALAMAPMLGAVVCLGRVWVVCEVGR